MQRTLQVVFQRDLLEDLPEFSCVSLGVQHREPAEMLTLFMASCLSPTRCCWGTQVTWGSENGFIRHLLMVNFLHLSNYFLKQPEQDSRKWCRVLGTLEGSQRPSCPQVKHRGPNHPTCCCMVWGILQQGSVCPHVQSSLQLDKPLHWVAENTRKTPSKKIHLWVSCTWEQNIASCQWLKGTDELSCQQWLCDLSEDVLYLWRRNNLFYRCSFPMKICTL